MFVRNKDPRIGRPVKLASPKTKAEQEMVGHVTKMDRGNVWVDFDCCDRHAQTRCLRWTSLLDMTMTEKQVETAH